MIHTRLCPATVRAWSSFLPRARRESRGLVGQMRGEPKRRWPGILILLPLLSGCIPRIEVAVPKDPITINMNVKIEHEIHIKVDKDVENLLKSQPGLF